MILGNLEYCKFEAGITTLNVELNSIIQHLQKVIEILILDYPEWLQPTVAQVLIPKAAYQLTDELEKIDKLLQDKSYKEPVINRFNMQCGRQPFLSEYIHNGDSSCRLICDAGTGLLISGEYAVGRKVLKGRNLLET